MKTIGWVVLALSLSLAHNAAAQGTGSNSARAKMKASAYATGKVTATKVIRGTLHAEFGLKDSDGLRADDRVIVVRPSAGNIFIDEIRVSIVDGQQAVGRCVRARGVEPGDIAIFQRTLNLDHPITANSRPNGDLFCEITFHAPPPGETRTTFNGRLARITWEGMIDIRDIEAVVYMDSVRSSKTTIEASLIKQMRINGLVLVPDGPKQTLIAAAVHDYRELARADAAERERIAIAQARIAADERVRIASVRANADAQVRIAEARENAEAQVRIAEARENAEAQVRIAQARAMTESNERLRGAEQASRERIRLAQIEREFDYAREPFAFDDSGREFNRAMNAVEGLLMIGACIEPGLATTSAVFGGVSKLIQAFSD